MEVKDDGSRGQTTKLARALTVFKENIVDELPPTQLLFRVLQSFYFKKWVGDNSNQMLDTLKEFIKEHGYSFEPIVDGQFHEFRDNEKKGWQVGSEFKTRTGKTHIIFTFGDFRKGEKFTFTPQDTETFSDAEKKDLLKKQKEQEHKIKLEKEKTQGRVAKRVAEEWETFSQSFAQNEYMKRKKISSFLGARLECSSVNMPNLIVPMRDIHNKLWGYQTITEDGVKTFQPGQRTQGLFHIIGEITDFVYIVEGFATGASVHEATGAGVVVAFNAGNLTEVVKELRLKYPNIPMVICADDDCYREENVGVQKSNEAASEGLCSVVLPQFKNKISKPTDFNDLHLLEGIEEVKKQLEAHKVVAPEDVIRTERTGFHLATFKGNRVVYEPQYEDLRKFFERSYTYKMLGGSQICYVWDGQRYKEFDGIYISNFAQRNFSPIADNKMCAEFKGLVTRTNLKDPEWFHETTAGKINFQNCVLDMNTLEISEHSEELGFRYVLDYDYDPEAKCPTWDKFLNEVTRGSAELQAMLLEFMGYAISNDSCWAQKALILDGEGRNGKSTFIAVLRALAGKGNYSALTVGDLNKEANRQMLDGKLFNIAEETPTKGMVDSSIFKAIVGGGEVQVRQLYKSPYILRNRAKLIFACNALPDSKDTTPAFFRRLLIAPFRETFSHTKGNRDPQIEEKLLAELPGIFNQAIQGYKTLVKNQQFSYSRESKEALDEYQHAIDPMLDWVDEAIETHPLGNGMDDKFNSLSEMYQEYKRHMEANGFEPLNNKHFGRKLSGMIEDYRKRIVSKRIDGVPHKLIRATSLYGKTKY